MDEGMNERIAARLKAVGLSASAASKAAGLGSDYIRDLRRKNSNPGYEALSKLAEVLKTSPEYLLHDNVEAHTVDVVGLPVLGVIEAGQFRDVTLVSQDEDYPTVNVVRDKRFEGARQYAMLVSGDSMNLRYPDGCYVICAEFGDTGLALKPGLVVHVERSIAGTHLVENTLKQIEDRDGRRFLMPRSTNPRHKPIEVNGDSGLEEWKVRGVVIGSYQPENF